MNKFSTSFFIQHHFFLQKNRDSTRPEHCLLMVISIIEEEEAVAL
jgi:hypothetical protein